MEGTIAITDFDWYKTLLAGGPHEEVNFWLPSARRAFRAPLHSPFFFKLRHPHNAIAGFGLFQRYVPLPDWLAWEAFGEKNGCRSFPAMRDRIARIRAGYGYQEEGGSNEIGCVLVARPVFFPENEWVKQPADWKVRTQRAKKYDLTMGEGQRVWHECQDRLHIGSHRHLLFAVDSERADPVEFMLATARQRLGQGTFRIEVTQAYDRACAVTGEHSLPALEAAHIRPVCDDGPMAVSNGLLLRADLHRLFDRGYLTVTPEHRLKVSGRLKADFSNGKSYYPFDDQEVHVPDEPGLRPSPDFLAWHNERCFMG